MAEDGGRLRVNPRSNGINEPEAILRADIASARRSFGGVEHALAHPDAFKRILAEAGGARGRDVATQFIDLVTRDANGVSTLSDDRRSEYAAAIQWMGAQALSGSVWALDRTLDPDEPLMEHDQEKVIAKARELGGIDGVKDDPTRPGIAAKFRDHRDRHKIRKPRSTPTKQPPHRLRRRRFRYRLRRTASLLRPHAVTSGTRAAEGV